MQVRSVVFDFDYTLADSSRGTIECVAYALDKLGYPVPPDEKIRKMIGLSLPATFDFLAGKQPDPPHEDFTRYFVEMADRIMLDRIVLFESARPLLNTLREKGIMAGIVSTKYHYRIQAFLEKEYLEDVFSVIIGGEEVTAHKPDPAGLFAAIQKLGCSPEETVYVGDSVTDAETAKRAGVLFVAVLTGVTPEEAFDDYEPVAVLPNLDVFPQLLA